MTRFSDNVDRFRDASRDRLESSRNKLTDAKNTALELVSESGVVARERMSESKARAAELLGQGREVATEKTAAATEVTKRVAQTAADRSNEVVAKNPLAVVTAGIAVGAVIAALLPRTKTETKIVGGAGKAVNAAALAAIVAAKQAGMDQVSELGLNSDTMRKQFKDLLGKFLDTAKSAATAASDAVNPDETDKQG